MNKKLLVLLIFVGLLLVILTALGVFVGIYLANNQEQVGLYNGTYIAVGSPQEVGETTLWAFRNIPYGRAGRLEYPVRCGHDVNCSSPRYKEEVKCLQVSDGTSSVEGTEDCLVLTVITPNISASLPTVVWIHGGALTPHDNPLPGPSYDFALEINSVVVSINYRLHLLGFLSVQELFDESLQTYGNYGHADQITALQWIQENIGHFGGDPGRVTLLGEGDGATSLLALLVSPLANHLFHNLIPLSPALQWKFTKEEASKMYRLLITKLKCSDVTDKARCIRATDGKYIIGNYTNPSKGLKFFDFPLQRPDNAGNVLHSVLDGSIVEKPPIQYSSLSFKPGGKINIFLGNTGQESSIHGTDTVSSYTELQKTLSSKLAVFKKSTTSENNFANKSVDAIVSEIIDVYNIEEGKSPEYYFKFYHTIITDIRSTCPSNHLVNSLSQSKFLNVHRIYFDYNDPVKLFCHGDEIRRGFGAESDPVQQLFRDMVMLIAHNTVLPWQESLFMTESFINTDEMLPQEKQCNLWKRFKMDYQYGWQS